MAKRRYWLVKSEPDAYSIDDLERDARTDFYRLAGSGRMGSRDAPADRNSSRAASESQLVECARRLGQLHACYASSFPDPPDGVFDDASDDSGSKRARGAAGFAEKVALFEKEPRAELIAELLVTLEATKARLLADGVLRG